MSHPGRPVAILQPERPAVSSSEVAPHRGRPTTDEQALDRSLQRLDSGRKSLASMSVERRIEIIEQCLSGVAAASREWIDLACQAKGIPADSDSRAEEIFGGPVATARQLTFFLRTMRQIAKTGRPQLPSRPVRRADGRTGVRVTPCPGAFDPITFIDFKATTWLQPGIAPDDVPGLLAPAYRSLEQTGTSLVLGAGNVAGIPASDMLSKLCVDNRNVLLKMNPVNDYLGPVFERAFAALIDEDLLQIVYGDAGVGACAIADDRIHDIHITGSERTYNAIVWGDPDRERGRGRSAKRATSKPVTSELGNVSPWIIVPGAYSRGQVRSQSEHIAVSLTNNAAFNCIATRCIVTWKQWPGREDFLRQIEHQLAGLPQRRAYYPGAHDRYEQFTGLRPDQAQSALSGSDRRCGRLTTPHGTQAYVAGRLPSNGPLVEECLPWTLIRDMPPTADTLLFDRESFVNVCVEVPIDAASPEAFLRQATAFCNTRLWGTLAATMTVPRDFRRHSHALLEACTDQLRYGVVGRNQWAGLIFALMSPPWGGHPSSTPVDIQSGSGWVHNSLMLDQIEKTVLDGPLTVLPKAVWIPSFANPEAVGWAMFDLMRDPSLTNLMNVSFHAVKGAMVGGCRSGGG